MLSWSPSQSLTPFINLIGPEWAVRLVIWLPTGLDCEQKEEGVRYITVSFFQAKVQSETDATTVNGVGFVACEHANKAIRKAAPQTDSSPLGRMIHLLSDKVTNLRNISCLDWSPVLHYFQSTEEQINKYINEKKEQLRLKCSLLWHVSWCSLCCCGSVGVTQARERKNPIRQGTKITINLFKYFAICPGGFQLRRLNRAYGFIIWGYLFHILFFLSPRVECVARRTLVPALESEVLSYIFTGWENKGEASPGTDKRGAQRAHLASLWRRDRTFPCSGCLGVGWEVLLV